MSGDGQTRQVGHVEKQGSQFAKQRQAIVFRGFVIDHDHNIIEETVNGGAELRERCQQLSVLTSLEQWTGDLARRFER